MLPTCNKAVEISLAVFMTSTPLKLFNYMYL